MESKKKASASSSVWFKSFMIFLLVIIVALSLGLTIFYFMHETEDLYLDKTIISTNLNDEFEISIVHTNPDKSTEFELSYPEQHLQKVSVSTDGLTYKFKAIEASRAGVNIVLTSSNDKFTSNMTCLVTIADGTAMNPFVIRTAAELAAIGGANRPLSAYYRQANDIDLSGYATWTPVAPSSVNKFTGSYNGNYCTVSNLKIVDNETSASQYAGLFGYVTGSISNLKIVNANINSKAQYVGIAAGYSEGLISRVETTGSVVQTVTTAASNTDRSSLGGVVGKVNRNKTDTQVDRCSFVGTLNKSNTFENGSNIGGLVGTNVGGSILNSYARATAVSGANDVYAGGLIGYNRHTTEAKGQDPDTCTTNMKGNILNAYAVFNGTQLSGTNTVYGGVVGYNTCVNGTANATAFDDSTKNINRYIGVYYLQDGSHTVSWLNGQPDVDVYVNGVDSAALRNQATFATYRQEIVDGVKTKVADTWNFEKVWCLGLGENEGYPTLRFQGENVNSTIYDPATASIPVSGQVRTESDLRNIGTSEAALAEDYVLMNDIVLSDMEWTPIGNAEHPFTGSLTTDGGQSFTISHLKITSVNNEYAGLFGVIGTGAKIDGFKVEGTITRGKNVGMIAGMIKGTASNVVASGNIQITSSQTTENVGMAFGQATSSASISNITTDSTINISGTGATEKNIGGVVGSNDGYVSGNVKSSTGIVVSATNGSRIFAGGIAGYNSGSVSKAQKISASNIQITGKVAEAQIGGIVGYNRGFIDYVKVESINITANNIGENVYAGGIVGANIDQGTVEWAEIVAGNINAYNAGGIAGYNKSNSSSKVAIRASSADSEVKVFGNRIAGIIAKVDQGIVSNCATFAQLSGAYMSGFASIIEKPATVSNCFSAATFNLDAGKGYAETESEVFKVEFTILILDGDKVAGYFTNNVYDRNLAAGTTSQKSSKVILDWDIGNPDTGATSTEGCKAKKTFDDRGFSKTYWDIVDGEYPTIKEFIAA